MKLFKRIIVAFLIATAAGFLVWAPRPGQSLPKDRVSRRVLGEVDQREADAMKRIVDDFNPTVGREKHIYVRYLSMSNIDQKTLAACAAGVPPDIAGLGAPIVQFAALDALEPLEDMARARGITAQTYKPIYWEVCNYDGHLWCLISTPAAVALHYNKEVFRRERRCAAGRRARPRRPPAHDRGAGPLRPACSTGARGPIVASATCRVEPGWYLASRSTGSAGRSSIPTRSSSR